MAEATKVRYLNILQIYRGIAALMVVIHHTAGSLRFYHKVDSELLNFIGNIGKYGVDFFFVLSGFIISYTCYYKISEPNAFQNYVKNRLIRIYVPYLPIGILMLLLYSFYPALSNAERDISILTSITLFPDGNPALSVAWTLTFEIIFYLLFSLNFISIKLWNYFLIIWSVLLVLFNYVVNISVPNKFFQIFFSMYNIEFMLGYVLSMLIVYEKKASKKKLLLSSMFFYGCFFITQIVEIKLILFLSNILFSLGTLFLFYYSILYNNKIISLKNILMLIGNATYSIYLIHNPLQMIVVRYLPSLSWMLILVIVLIICSITGYVYYLIFEKYCLNKIKSLIKI